MEFDGLDGLGFRHCAVRIAANRIARLRGAEIERAVRDDAHRIKQLAAEKLHAHDALGGIDLEIFLKQEQIVGEPEIRAIVEQADQFGGE